MCTLVALQITNAHLWLAAGERALLELILCEAFISSLL
jgi:hypothetical protein